MEYFSMERNTNYLLFLLKYCTQVNFKIKYMLLKLFNHYNLM